MDGNLTRISRRSLLKQCGLGFGTLALYSLLAQERARASSENPLARRVPHLAPRAKRVIFLFMHGGPSHVDTFDYKPLLARHDGEPFPFAKPRVQFESTRGLLPSPWGFRQYGETGAWVSELFPHVSTVVDDLCFVKSMYGSNPAHGGALLLLHTGSDRFVRPSMGSWINYGLGTENQNLPGFITIAPSSSHGGVQNYSSAFLPSVYHGTAIGSRRTPISEAKIRHVENPESSPALQRHQLDLLRRMCERQLPVTGPDQVLESRIASFELAFRMQMECPKVMDLGSESEATRRLYGLDDPATRNFGEQCLLARRLSESGVRFVQCTKGGWDQHDNLREEHAQNSRAVDKPIAGLIHDLKTRGLLDETLVIWSGEFGRTPEGEGSRRNGRDHDPHGFTMVFAGGGVKPGSYGETDEFGYFSVKDKVHLHDFHATVLYLLGLDHTRLTYRFDGRDFRLTDIHGHVVHDILA